MCMKIIRIYNNKRDALTIEQQENLSFAKRGGEINLELVVLQLNINPGNNTEIVANCPMDLVLRLYLSE